MPERHYSDDEVAAIFRAAAEGAESQAVAGDHADGLTLRDLEGIAREVGISPLAVARAAQALDRPSGPVISQTFLGLPIAVERTVALDRRLTEPEWERLVVELRRVFHARGTVHADGSLRGWSNGNLHAMLEPTSTGYQLRLGTLKGDARASVAAGALTLGLSGVVGVLLAFNGTLRLPGWARRRRQQMDGIVERLTAPPPDDPADPLRMKPGT